MIPKLHLFNLIIPMYPLCVATGFLIGTVVLYWDSSKLRVNEKYVFPLMCFVEAGVIIGGKLLFLLVNIQQLPKYYQKFGFWGVFSKTGYVFYGGLFVGIIAIWLFSKIYKQIFNTSLIYVLSVTPLIHAFGRIGCFCAGCCYGIKYNGFLNVYIKNARRFPIQVLEATLLFFLFVVLQQFLFKRQNYVITVYFVGYGVIRFICEFLRGDETRGFIGSISISSWISILCLFIGCVIMIKDFRNYRMIKKDEIAKE